MNKSDSITDTFIGVLTVILLLALCFFIWSALGGGNVDSSACTNDPGLCQSDHEQYENLPMGG